MLGNKMPRTLRSQVQWLSVLPILGLVAVAIGMSGYLTHQQVDSEAYRKLQEVSHLVTTTTRDESQALSAKGQMLADDEEIQLAIRRQDRKSIHSRIVSFIRKNYRESLLVATPGGTVMEKAGNVSIVAVSPELKKIVKKSAAGKSTVKIVFQGNRLYTAAATTVISGHRVVGVLVNLSPIGDGVARALKKTTSDDVLIVHKTAVIGSTLALDAMPSHRNGSTWRMRIGRTTFVALSQTFPNADPDLNVTLVALRSYDDLAKPFRSFTTGFVPVLLIALVLAALLARNFAASLAKPLHDLVGNAKLVRDGKWPQPITVKRDDEIGLLINIFNDMTAGMKKNQDQLMNLVDLDPLTGLHNHRKFKERMDQEVFRACMSHKSLTLSLIDIDNFGTYNTKHGHVAGDEAIRTLGQLLSEVAPDVAFLARYGGEEFAILLPLSTIEDTEVILVRLKELCKEKFNSLLTFSAGIAEIGVGVSTGSGLALSAEMALSRSKQLGKDRFCRFEAVPGAANEEDPFQLQKFLQDSTLATIQTLAGAVDAKDPYTQGHSVRVAKFAADLARYKKCTAKYVDLVYKTGTLHDVGKIGVPDSILSKPARLEPEEQAIMETHPVLGELIVKKAPPLAEMLPGVRSHHERWDGRGYPDGLMGQQIPLLARYIALADTFDAMTSDRPYRKALSVEVALEEIRRKAGEQFDPDLAEAFVRMMTLHRYGLKAA
jgi:diguanylate cyclase (GGDEF)-like protein